MSLFSFGFELKRRAIGLRWKIPVRQRNSPAQLALSGVAALKMVNTKNSIEKIGIYAVIPR